MDFSSRARPDLLFSVLFASVSDQRIARAQRNSSCRRLPAGDCEPASVSTVLVCAYIVVAGCERPRTYVSLLGGPSRISFGGRKYLAASFPLNLLRLLSLCRQRPQIGGCQSSCWLAQRATNRGFQIGVGEGDVGLSTRRPCTA